MQTVPTLQVGPSNHASSDGPHNDRQHVSIPICAKEANVLDYLQSDRLRNTVQSYLHHSVTLIPQSIQSNCKSTIVLKFLYECRPGAQQYPKFQSLPSPVLIRNLSINNLQLPASDRKIPRLYYDNSPAGFPKL